MQDSLKKEWMLFELIAPEEADNMVPLDAESMGMAIQVQSQVCVHDNDQIAEHVHVRW